MDQSGQSSLIHKKGDLQEIFPQSQAQSGSILYQPRAQDVHLKKVKKKKKGTKKEKVPSKDTNSVNNFERIPIITYDKQVTLSIPVSSSRDSHLVTKDKKSSQQTLL